MDAWQKLLIDEEERDLFFIGEELNEMARILDSFDEVGWKADNGAYIRITMAVEAAISLTRQWKRDEQGNEVGDGYKGTIILTSYQTGDTVSVVDTHFTTLEHAMNVLGIDDGDEVWEVLEA